MIHRFSTAPIFAARAGDFAVAAARYFAARMARCATAMVAATTMVATLAVVAVAPDIAAAQTCKPRKAKPPVVLNGMGPCAFDAEALSYRGEPVQQALCLLRAYDHSRNLAPMLTSLPPALGDRVGRSSGLPARETLAAFVAKLDLDRDLIANLWRPVSRARDNDPQAPAARYFVIHDTSGPNFGGRSFPSDIDVSPKINNLRLFWCADGWAKAHAVVNRTGGVMLGHDFEIPWRETKFERAPGFDGALKGLFLHVELIQPRRHAPGRGRRNDAQAPTPGFTAAQYDRLALLYVIASVRAGSWMIPAFHAPIDDNIHGGHDDPQNFEIAAFARALEALIEELHTEEPLVSFVP